MEYVNKGDKTLEGLLEEMRADELANRKRVSEMIRREEEERCEKLGCFLTADDMIKYVLNGGIMVANHDTTDRIYFDKERNIIVHDLDEYDDGSGYYYGVQKTKTVDEFKAWCYRCEKHNTKREEPAKYFNPYWNPIENVSPADTDKQ